jgi:predicted DNA-binding protein (MmcQ/YjbR family)
VVSIGIPVVEVHSALLNVLRALPEALEEDGRAHIAFKIRRRSFLNLVTTANPDGEIVSVVTVKVGPAERESLLAIGHPFFRLGSSTAENWIGYVIDQYTDWDEIRELVADSYCLAAPKRLSDLVKAQNPAP